MKLTIATSSYTIDLEFPELSPPVKAKLLYFLMSECIEKIELTPTLFLERRERDVGEYYRFPRPIWFSPCEGIELLLEKEEIEQFILLLQE